MRGADRVPEGMRGALALALLCALVPADAARVLISGEVRAENAEAIYVPPSDSSPVVLRFYAPDGARLAAGEVAVRIDPGGSLSQIRALGSQIEQAEARAAKELAELQVKAIDAERAHIEAEAAHEKATIDAAIPREHLSGLDFDRYRGERERTARELELKRTEFAAAEVAVTRRRADGVLEVQKLQAERIYHEAQVANAEQRATAGGIVIHGFDNQRGQRYDEGSSAYPGQKIGEIVGDGGMRVRAHVLEPDRRALREGQDVEIRFDALPQAVARGRIVRLAGAPEPKAEWGDGRYFSLDIELPKDLDLPLRPGMSARITAGTDDAIVEAQAGR
jgi:HlyD family secretion protein